MSQIVISRHWFFWTTVLSYSVQTCFLVRGKVGRGQRWEKVSFHVHFVCFVTFGSDFVECIIYYAHERCIYDEEGAKSVKQGCIIVLLTLSCAIVRIRTIGRGLQKNGQRTFAWVLGSLWWLGQEREQHGQHFVSVWSILVKFSIFYRPQRHANSNNGDGRRRSFSFGYIFGDFSR